MLNKVGTPFIVDTSTPEGCKKLREHLKYSINDMSLNTGYGTDTLTRFESGEIPSEFETAVKNAYYVTWLRTLADPFEIAFYELIEAFPHIKQSEAYKKILNNLETHGIFLSEGH